MALVDIYNNCTNVVPTGFSVTNIITIINMCVTAAVGIYIGISFKKNYETTKSVKDYFINEVSLLSQEYNDFVTSLCSKKKSPTEVLVWFKKMSIRIENFETVLSSQFKLDSNLLISHNKFKMYFTGTDFFNINFEKPKLDLTIEVQHGINEEYGKVSSACNNLVISIIKSKRK